MQKNSYFKSNLKTVFFIITPLSSQSSLPNTLDIRISFDFDNCSFTPLNFKEIFYLESNLKNQPVYQKPSLKIENRRNLGLVR